VQESKKEKEEGKDVLSEQHAQHDRLWIVRDVSYAISDIDLELLLRYRTVHPYIKRLSRLQNQSRRNRKRVGFLHGNALI